MYEYQFKKKKKFKQLHLDICQASPLLEMTLELMERVQCRQQSIALVRVIDKLSRTPEIKLQFLENDGFVLCCYFVKKKKSSISIDCFLVNKIPKIKREITK